MRYISQRLRSHLEQLYGLGLCMWHFLTVILPLFSADRKQLGETAAARHTEVWDPSHFPVLLTLLPRQT